MFRRMRSVVRFLAVAALLSVVACGAEDAGPDEPETSEPGGRLDAAELQGRWWSWSYESHHAAVSDKTGADCDVDQPADVWFLAGTFGGRAERSCTLPADRPLAFPIVNITTTVESDCQDFLASASGEAKLDGRPVTIDTLEATEVTIKTDHGPGDYVACGLWAQTEGLDAGRHRLTLSGRAGSFRTSVDYTLIVE